MANVLFSSLANLRAPRKWAAWFPNRPTITCAQCWIPRAQETHHGSGAELQSCKTYPYRDSREHSRGHPTRSSGYYSLAHTQPVKSSPCASYQKGAYGQLAAYTVRMRTAGRSLVACLHFLPLFHCLQYR